MPLILIVKACILGVVEGLTEFIPVSSTGHLILADTLLGLNSEKMATFDVAIQLGAILAVVVYYKRFFLNLVMPSQWFKHDFMVILVAMLPAIFLGVVFHSFIKEHLFSPITVAIGLFLGAILMLIAQKKASPTPQTTEIAHLSYKQALTIGLYQCLALWPGFSRSGSTISGGLLAKLDYKTSAAFSFIVAVPLMAAAVSFDLIKTAPSLTSQDFALIGIGGVVSFGVALLSIVVFLRLLEKLKLAPFAWYRIVVSVVIVWVFWKA